MVGTKSTLEANDLQEDLVGEPFGVGKMFRSEGPRHSPVQQGLNHLGLQHIDFQTKRGGRAIIQLRAELFDACPHETDSSFDFEREVSVFVDNTGSVYNNRAVWSNLY